jgi:hypothetical protein
MNWTPATQPPPFIENDYGWKESLPVLGYCIDGRMRVLTYEWIDEDDDPCWYTAYSGHWDMSKKVTHWMPLPNPPSNPNDPTKWYKIG